MAPNHPDYANMKVALGFTEEVAVHINEYKRKADIGRKLLEIQSQSRLSKNVRIFDATKTKTKTKTKQKQQQQQQHKEDKKWTNFSCHVLIVGRVDERQEVSTLLRSG